MTSIGTVIGISASKQEGMKLYRVRCPRIPGNHIGATFEAPEGKYETGDSVFEDEPAPMMYSGKWGEDGKALY